MRLFVAVWPPDDVVARIAALDRSDQAALRWTTADQWHVTLRFFGEVDDPAPVAAALRDAAERVPALRVRLGPQTRRVAGMLWAPVTGLDELARAVTDATAAFGDPPDPRPFRGHITLARERGRGHGRHVRAFAGQELDGVWTVTTVELVRSRLDADGARYETLVSASLGGRGPEPRG